MLSGVNMVVAVVCGLAMLALLILFILDAWRFRGDLRGLWRYGAAAAVVLLVTEAVLITLIVTCADPKPSAIVRMMGTDIVAAFRLLLFTTMGIHYSRRIGVRTFFCLKPEPVSPPKPDVRATADAVETEIENGGAIAVVAPAPEEHASVQAVHVVAPSPPPPRPGWAESEAFKRVRGAGVMLAITLAAGLAAVFYTEALFWLARPRISPMLKQLQETLQVEFGIEEGMSLIAAIALVEVAFAEELVFRLGIQSFFGNYIGRTRGRYWFAVVATAALWTLLHSGMVQPDWVKYAQIFPLGVALGWLYRKCGIESCIAVHAMLNLITPLMPYAQTQMAG